MHEVNNDLMILLMQISTQTYSPNRNRNKVAIITPRIRLKRHNKISLHCFPTVDNILWNNQLLIVQWGRPKNLRCIRIFLGIHWRTLSCSRQFVDWKKPLLSISQCLPSSFRAWNSFEITRISLLWLPALSIPEKFLNYSHSKSGGLPQF